MKKQYIFPLSVLLFSVFLVACGPSPAPVESIAKATYYHQPDLLERAWQLPVAQTYRDRFEYQANWAFCGPATIINLFHSLKLEGYTQDSLFERSRISYWKARFLGLTLDELAELVRANTTREVTVVRDVTLDEFRRQLQQANDPRFRFLINFDRRPLFGVSIGHHSPLGGYLADMDLVFVLDVLDRYQPFLVPTARLFEAVDTVDSETGLKRGLLRIAVPEASMPPG